MDRAAARGQQPGARVPGAVNAATREASLVGGEDAGAHGPSFTAPFERFVASLKRMASNYAALAVLDLRRSAVQLAWLVAGGIFICVLLVSAWLAGVVALAIWLLRDGMPLPGVLLIAAALNAVGALLVGLRIRSVFGDVPFSATLRQITADAPDPEHKEA